MVPLSRGLEFQVEGLPHSSRPGNEAVPMQVDISAWEAVRRENGVVEWRADAPVSHVDYGHSTRKRPAGLELRIDDQMLRYDRVADDEELPIDTWSIRDSLLRLRLDEAAGPPQKTTLKYLRANEAERRLNLGQSGLSITDFVTTSVQPGRDAYRGLLIPAPTKLTWNDLLVPSRGVVGFEATLFDPPWVLDARSDGATVVLEIDGVVVKQLELDHGGHRRLVRFDISKHAGQKVDLSLRVDGGGSNDLDYVFLEEPVVYTPKKDSKRVVLLFADTMRADALGVYGAGPLDSPNLDGWAEEALVFEQARSTAPWTLPSARSALSGQQPDLWDPEQSLPARLAREGFLTHGVVSNAFLTPQFGMGGSWSRYSYGFVAPVRTQVDRALASLDAWHDRDMLLMVHFMETHLPYREPEPYRSMWAPEAPEGLTDGMGRNELKALPVAMRDEVEPYVRARYRQNVNYLDHELKRLLAVLEDDDLVVFYSDHGEEFWEHGSIEHGHSLHDELLHVPLIIKGPGIAPGRSDAPVSLLDITPTVLAALDVSTEELDGSSLIGDVEALRGRALGFGYLLYGNDAWALLEEGQKWVVKSGRERVYDLNSDPLEKEGKRPSPEESAAMAKTLGDALGRPMHPVWRVSMGGGNKNATNGARTVRLTQPGGFAAAWTAYDPLDALAQPALDDAAATITSTERKMPREFYVVPADATDPTGLTLSVQGASDEDAAFEGDKTFLMDGRGMTVLSVGVGSKRVAVTPTWAPEPSRSVMPGVAPEREEELRVLGYLD